MEDKEDIKLRKKLCYDGWFYSHQRIDLLVITINGASIYIILETLKFSFSNPLCYLTLLKIAGIFFIISIIVNFISQYTGMKANYHDMLFCDSKIKASLVPTQEEIVHIKRCDKTSEGYNNATNWLNISSMILMFVGLSLIISYFLVSF